jgi:AraC-like DNA-binding protein
VSQAKELLQHAWRDPPSLEELAAAVNLSPFHFARVLSARHPRHAAARLG